MSDRPITCISITFIDETTRSTFEEVVREIRRKFGVQVTFFIDTRDSYLYGERTVYFEGPINPDEASLYSRLSKKARRYIESMRAYLRQSTFVHISTCVEIEFTDTTPKYRVEKVLSEIRRKFGVQVTSCGEFLGTFNTEFEGPINPDEAFMLYSRSLSKTARKCIKSMGVDRIERSVREPLDGWPAFLRNHDEPIRGDVGADVNPLEVDELLRQWLVVGCEGFRLDAVPYLFGDDLLIGWRCYHLSHPDRSYDIRPTYDEGDMQ